MFKSDTFHTLRFITIFLLLTLFLYVYVGVISPGGKIYSSYLDEYANFPAWISYFISQCAKALLLLFHYDVYQKAANNITIRGGRGVTIIWACLGFGVMSYWVAFVTSHVSNWKYKLKWTVAGIGLITSINILRIVLIALANYYHWKAFYAIDPHPAFNMVSYIAILGLTAWFVFKYNRKSKKR